MLTGQDLINNMGSYQAVSDCIKKSSIDDIVSAVCQIINIDDSNMLFTMTADQRLRNGTVCTYMDLLIDLKNHIDSYDRLYSRLYDDKSRNILRLLIAFCLVPDNSFLQTICEKEKIKYFDSDIYSPNNSDVFIECSCHDNSVPQYIKDNCTKIYLYGSKFTEDSETNPDNIITIRFPDFETVNATAISYNDLFAVKIDKDITEKTKAIIIDNDLLNIPKLIGAKNHIKNDFPLIAIGINDSIESIYEIPEIIDNIHSNYKLYIGHYIGTESRDTVLYAISPQKRPKESIKFKKVAAIAPYSTHGWSNAQLTKDCGLIPFLLYKNYGMDVSFVGVTDRVEDYPSA